MARFGLIRAVACALLGMTIAASAQTPVAGTDRFVAHFQPANAGDGVLTITCTDGSTSEFGARGAPIVTFETYGEETGILVLRYLESQGVIWKLSRLKLIPVTACTVGAPVPFVLEESYTESNPVERPDIKRLLRTPHFETADGVPVVRIESRSQKTFLDPEGGKPYARYLKRWPDESWTIDFEALTLKRNRSDFDEITARTRLKSDNVSAASGWARVDTPLQRSEE